MSFKIGDRVRRINESCGSKMQIGQEGVVTFADENSIALEGFGTGYLSKNFELVAPKKEFSSVIQAPVLKRTIKEGQVHFTDLSARAWVKVHGKGCVLDVANQVMTATNLRELAALCNELADVIEEK